MAAIVRQGTLTIFRENPQIFLLPAHRRTRLLILAYVVNTTPHPILRTYVQRNSIPRNPNQARMTDFCSILPSLRRSHLASMSRASCLCTLQGEYSQITLSGDPIENFPVNAALISLSNADWLSTFAEYRSTCSSYICWILRFGDVKARRLFRIILALA